MLSYSKIYRVEGSNCPLSKFFLLPNQKTCRKCKDSFEIVRKRATKYVFNLYELGPSLDPLKLVLVQHGVLQAHRNKGIP